MKCPLAYEDALDIDWFDKVTQQGSLVAQHLPLSDLVHGRYAEHFGAGVLEGGGENREHLKKEACQ